MKRKPYSKSVRERQRNQQLVGMVARGEVDLSGLVALSKEPLRIIQHARNSLEHAVACTTEVNINEDTPGRRVHIDISFEKDLLVNAAHGVGSDPIFAAARSSVAGTLRWLRRSS